MNWNKFLFEGKIIEDKVKSYFENVENATKQQDIKDGVDFSINIKFDVKAAKKIRRADEAPSYDFTWLEYRNVNGNFGSLLKNADILVFEREKYWDFRSREETFQFFKSMCINEKNEWKSKEILKKGMRPELYVLYQRENRQDVIMLVDLNHPQWKSLFTIPKSNG